MKKYVTPMFYAENYAVSSSIASNCQYKVGDPDDHAALALPLKDPDTGKKAVYCSVQDGGHTLDKGSIYAQDNVDTIVIFNDGSADTKGCTYDWAGGSITKGNTNYGSFGKAVFGAVAGNDNHIPAYKGQSFFS